MINAMRARVSLNLDIHDIKTGTTIMKKPQPGDKSKYHPLPKDIANMPVLERQAMEKARKEGKFDARAHLANSPIGRAAAKGFPIPKK